MGDLVHVPHRLGGDLRGGPLRFAGLRQCAQGTADLTHPSVERAHRLHHALGERHPIRGLRGRRFDQRGGFAGRRRGAQREGPHFLRHHRKAAPRFSGAGGLHGGIEGQQIGLEGDLLDRVHDARGRRATLRDARHRLRQLVGGVQTRRRRGPTVPHQGDRVGGGACVRLAGAVHIRQPLRDGIDGRPLTTRPIGEKRRRGRNFRGGGRELRGRRSDLAQCIIQIGDGPIDRRLQRGQIVGIPPRHPHRDIARRHRGHDLLCFRNRGGHRRHDGAHPGGQIPVHPGQLPRVVADLERAGSCQGDIIADFLRGFLEATRGRFQRRKRLVGAIGHRVHVPDHRADFVLPRIGDGPHRCHAHRGQTPSGKGRERLLHLRQTGLEVGQGRRHQPQGGGHLPGHPPAQQHGQHARQHGDADGHARGQGRRLLEAGKLFRRDLLLQHRQCVQRLRDGVDGTIEPPQHERIERERILPGIAVTQRVQQWRRARHAALGLLDQP